VKASIRKPLIYGISDNLQPVAPLTLSGEVTLQISNAIGCQRPHGRGRGTEGGHDWRFPSVHDQPRVIPSIADDGAMSGKRLMRKELSRPSKPAIIGTNSAT
jgi:hypothetical protein